MSEERFDQTMRIDLSAESEGPSVESENQASSPIPPQPSSNAGPEEDAYQDLLHSLYDATFLTDTSGRIHEINARACRLFRCPESALLGLPITELIKGITPHLMEILEENLKEGRFTVLEVMCVRAGQERFPAEVAIYRLQRKQQGRNLCFFVRDSTYHKQTEEALQKARDELDQRVNERTLELQESNQRLEQEIQDRKSIEQEIRIKEQFLAEILESIQDGIIVFDQSLHIARMNSTAYDLFAFAGAAPGKHCNDVMGQASLPGEACIIDQVLKQGKACREVIPLHHPSNPSEALWLEIQCYPLQASEPDEIRGVVSIYRNITSLRRAERMVQVSEERFKKLFEQSSDGIILHDTHGLILDCNQAACHLLNVPPDQVLGHLFQELFVEKDRERVEQATRKIEPGEAWRTDAQLIGPVPVEISANLVDPERGIIQEVMRDISQRKKSEQALQDAKDAAEQASQLKSEFLADISHEIRTPLNGIIGFAEVILASHSLKEVHHQAETILHESESLHKIIDELLDHAKIEAGRMVLDIQPFDLNQLVSRIEKSSQVQLRDSNIRFELDWDETIPHFVEGDPLRLREVLVNLISNAIKFTETGSIKLSVRQEQQRDNKTVLLFAVQDTGIGIPPERLKSIFQRFIQADKSTTRKYGGSGLGITISHQLVELMGGQMSVESQVGEGSRFWFTLPMAIGLPPPPTPDETRQRQAAEEPTERAPTGRILIAEDYPPNQDVARLHLESAGHLVDVVENGAEAVKACHEIVYDLVLMDVQMPELDGYDATRQIRANASGLSPRVPILGMTANADQQTRENCLEAGMDEVLAKPIRRKSFLAAISRYLEKSREDNIDNQLDDSIPVLVDPTQQAAPPLDWTFLKRELGNDQQLAQRVFLRFISRIEKLVANLQQAYDEHDMNAVSMGASQVQQHAERFAADALTNAAGHLADVARAGHAHDTQQACLLLNAELKRLKQFMRNTLETPTEVTEEGRHES